MTPEPDPTVETREEQLTSPEEPLRLLTGRFVSLHFLLAALRRTRRLWLAAGVVGFLAGGGYHALVPVKYSATATLYLAHPAGSANTVEAQNDLALLDTSSVADRAIAALGAAGRGLTASSLLGKAPATITSGNVLTLAISGPSPSAAVRRTNAVVTAYLGFRASLFEAQNRSLVTAADHQLATLQGQVQTLTSEIGSLAASAPGQQLASLQAQRAAATTAITGLQQTVQQGDLDTLSVVNGSRVITPATAVVTSLKKVIAVDALTGLAAGLGLAVIAVIVQAVLSDRLRRREDIAALLGAPVAVSVGRLPRRRHLRRRSVRDLATTREPTLLPLVHFLQDRISADADETVLVVTADDPTTPAAALATVAANLAQQGKTVVLVDETHDRAVARALGGSRRPGLHAFHLGSSGPLSVVVPPRPWELPDRDVWDGVSEDVGRADAVLVIASVDPGAGAWHLRRWTSEAVVAVTVGRSTSWRIAALTELLGAAGLDVAAGVLLEADAHDESTGLTPRWSNGGGRLLDVVRAVVPAAVTT